MDGVAARAGRLPRHVRSGAAPIGAEALGRRRVLVTARIFALVLEDVADTVDVVVAAEVLRELRFVEEPALTARALVSMRERHVGPPPRLVAGNNHICPRWTVGAPPHLLGP